MGVEARLAAQELLLRALIGRLVVADVLKPGDIEGIVAWAERLAGEDEEVRAAVKQLASGASHSGTRGHSSPQRKR